MAAVAEAEEVVVVVEELGDDDIGAGVDFAFQVREVDLRARRFLMRFGIAGDGDAEVGELAVEEGDEFVGVSITAIDGAEGRVALGRVAAEGDDVLDVELASGAEVRADLVGGAADAGEVRGDGEVKFAVDAGDDV